ncbi:hypothetical protein DPMN_138792 [Dreissena polymorpha]|uniref:Uncharacterized protein n=1 Tax=Dreissena polymorpha TaxID=45954 RepID=A0A9D4G4I0_DREPO|nr:hypothetical protein DPMN_138792 [Dreissena polymorpha]
MADLVLGAGVAKDYVDTILSASQAVVRESIIRSARKRHHSEIGATDFPDFDINSCKKSKQSPTEGTINISSVKSLANARRALYRHTPSKVDCSDVEQLSTQIHDGKTDSVKSSGVNGNMIDPTALGMALIMDKLESLAREIKNLSTSVTDRIDKLEVELEKKLSNKISNIIDKRITSEMKKVSHSIDEKVDTLRADISSDIDSLSGKVNSLSDIVNTLNPGTNVAKDVRKLNLIFRKYQNQ